MPLLRLRMWVLQVASRTLLLFASLFYRTHQSIEHRVAEQEEECLVKQVDMTVPKTDDTTVPVLTFRMWVLGVASCMLLWFVNQFYWYRTLSLTVVALPVQIVVVPLGHLMARTITTRKFLKGSRWEFSLNPGPFNVKEHVLITILANSGALSIYATHILTAVKLIYKRQLSFIPALLLILTTQMLGFGLAGLFRNYLVEAGEMWWPSNLAQVSLFRALHEKAKRPKGSVTRTQFFVIVLIASFAYYTFPGYLFMMLTSVSWVCWVAPGSVLFQQLGSGMNGLGLGSFGADWTVFGTHIGSPLVSPWFATANVAAGFIIIMYVMTPLIYYNNVYHAKNFPIYSDHLFMANGTLYPILGIINADFEIDKAKYAEAGQVYFSTIFVLSAGLRFATLSATVVHVLLFHGKDMVRQANGAFKSGKIDIHTKLMQKYKQVPMWWFYTILILTISASVFACQYFIHMLQLPYWGVFLACAIAFFFTLPTGVIRATTNQQASLRVLTEYIIGFIYPGRPVANMCFNVYAYVSMTQALEFLSDFKLSHYMKIPPRSMFMVQIVGIVISSLAYLMTAWWMIADIPQLCDTHLLPEDSPWTCPMDHVLFNQSVIWGLVGAQRIFGDLGVYPKINWFFAGGAVLPMLVWAFPGQRWISHINIPVQLGVTSMMSQGSSVNFTSWITVGFMSGFVFYRYRPQIWERYNYVLSGGVDAGTTLKTILLFFSLRSRRGIGSVDWWGNNPEGCPMASCPTAKGMGGSGSCPRY